MFNIVSTPIGNLEDITYRAVRTLKNSDIILCEDTRHSRILLDRFEIQAELISYHKFNESERVDYIIAKLQEGKEVSLITDAGTPIISDPGFVIVDRLKKEGMEFTAIPGACACINALVLSGMDSSSFMFVGFLPKNKKRTEFIKNVENVTSTLVFYISPHSVNEDIEDLYKVLGSRQGVLIKEMTKMFEKAIDITLTEKSQLELKGEMVLVLEGKEIQKGDCLQLSPMEHLMGYINSGMTKNDAIKRVAKERNVPKNDIYKLLNFDE